MFLINRNNKYHILTVNSISPRIAELILYITKRYNLNIMQIYAPTTTHSAEDISSFYNDVGETLTRTSGNINGQIWGRIEKRKRRHLDRMDNIKTG